MKVTIEFDTNNDDDMGKLRSIFFVENENYNLQINEEETFDKADVVLINKANDDSWDWALEPWKQNKTRQRALEIVGLVNLGRMGCAQIASRLSEQASYQTVRNQLLELVKVGALVKENTKYFLSDRAKDTINKCLE